MLMAYAAGTFFCHNYVMGTRQKQPITFWCEHGSHEVTEEHGPGQTPRYWALR